MIMVGFEWDIGMVDLCRFDINGHHQVISSFCFGKEMLRDFEKWTSMDD